MTAKRQYQVISLPCQQHFLSAETESIVLTSFNILLHPLRLVIIHVWPVIPMGRYSQDILYLLFGLTHDPWNTMHTRINLGKNNHPNVITPNSSQCMHAICNSRKYNSTSTDTNRNYLHIKHTEDMQNYEHHSKKKEMERIITMCPVVELAHGGEDPLQVSRQGARVYTIPIRKAIG